MHALLSGYRALLLDMHCTFMFDIDRFGPEQDYAATYQRLGGSRLAPAAVNQLLGDWFAILIRRYEDELYEDCFPSLSELLREVTPLPEAEMQLLEAVFAHHERGVVPTAHARTVQQLARHFPLAIVSNLWAPSHYWHEPLQQSGLWDCFSARIFSSDSRYIKPHPNLFLQALAQLDVAPHQALMIGDSFSRDVQGAARAGIDALWIDAAAWLRGDCPPPAKGVIPDLPWLLRCSAA